MERLIDSAIEDYVLRHSTGVPPLLEELEEETKATMKEPDMLTGRVEGLFLQLLVRISGARRVLEVGTFTGYGALMMAGGLPADGELITCEMDPGHAAFARRYFDRSPYRDRIRLIVGPAMEAMKTMEGESIDFIFIDADKPSYPDYYTEGMRLLRRGGLMAADNALWSGKVISPQDEDSRAIAEFNRMAMEDQGSQNVILTVRDGIHLIRKL